MFDLSQLIAAVIILLMGLAVGILAAWWWFRSKRSKSTTIATPTLNSQITELRAVGELRVFKGVSKDILTHVDHSFGDFGRKYLSWAFTKKKLAMVFEFEMDFSYDLRSEYLQLRNEQSSNGTVAVITLPPCKVEVSIKNLQFYDEQRAKFLPWLLPDLVQGFFNGRFSEEDKNALINAAKGHALAQAQDLFVRYRPQVENSAFQAMRHIGQAFGNRQIRLEFPTEINAISSADTPGLLGESLPPQVTSST
jgi:Protein of unknown function (DUF4230)